MKPINVHNFRALLVDKLKRLGTTLTKKRVLFSLPLTKKVREDGRKAVVKKARSKIKVKKEKKIHVKLRYLMFFLLGLICCLLFLVLPVTAYFWYGQLPQPNLLERQLQNGTTKILDRKGRLLYELYIDKKYDPVVLDKIPDHVIKATLAIEDESFYTHPGFDLKAMLRAGKSITLDKELQGGSTITQQLIKNVLLTPERTFSRKIKEVVLAVLVEREYSKDQILELYLNNVPYGGTAYGIQAASQKYFGKNVFELSLAESTLLAGLTSAPSAYSPLQGNYDLAKFRQRQVLDRMVDLKYITSDEATLAYDQTLEFAPQIEYIRAPHFVNLIRNQLYDLYGQRTVDLGGLTVITTLDLDLQDKVQSIVSEEVENSKDLNFSNGAAVVLDSQKGEILAYVGSVDYFSANSGNYDVASAYRQPGSSIKPVTYALALEKGYSASTIIEDSPITYQYDGQKYSPKNYDGKYHGKISLRQALANSYNVPAVKVVNKVGIDNMVELGRSMGLENWHVGDGSYGMSVTLGGKEVKLVDLVSLYATFARSGEYKNETALLSVKDRYGFEMFHDENEGAKVMKESTAYIISSILSDNTARSNAFGPNSQLHIPNKTVAVKTGTTNDIRDNLTIGYTPSYTVGVWVGNNDNTPMNPRLASGLTGAAPIWNKIMTYILEGTENEHFDIPEGIITKEFKECAQLVEVYDKETSDIKNPCQELESSEKATRKQKKDDN